MINSQIPFSKSKTPNETGNTPRSGIFNDQNQVGGWVDTTEICGTVRLPRKTTVAPTIGGSVKPNITSPKKPIEMTQIKSIIFS